MFEIDVQGSERGENVHAQEVVALAFAYGEGSILDSAKRNGVDRVFLEFHGATRGEVGFAVAGHKHDPGTTQEENGLAVQRGGGAARVYEKRNGDSAEVKRGTQRVVLARCLVHVNEHLGAVVLFEDFVAAHFVADPVKLPGELKPRTGRLDALLKGEVVEVGAALVLYREAPVARAVKGAETVEFALIEASNQYGAFAVGRRAVFATEVDAAKAVGYSLEPATVVEVAVGVAGGAHAVPAVAVDAGVGNKECRSLLRRLGLAEPAGCFSI